MEFFKNSTFDSELLELYRSYNREHYVPLLEHYIFKITGRDDLLPACVRIFNSLTIINAVSALFGIFFLLFFSAPVSSLMTMLFCIVMNFTAYYLCYVKCKFEQAAIFSIISIYTSLGYLYFLFGGVSAVFLLSFLVFNLNFLFIIRPARHLKFTAFNLLLILIAFFVQIRYPDMVNTATNSPLILAGNIAAGAYAVIVLYIGMYIMKRESDMLREVAEDKAESLREVARVQNQMISIISHDVRSPLANIEQMLQMVNNGMIPEPKRKEFDRQLLTSTRQTREILESMVTWTRAQVSDLALVSDATVNCDFDVVLRNELPDWEEAAAKKNINLSYHAYCPLPALIKADKNLAKTVLRNLIFNAIKFTPEGGQVIVGIAESGEMLQLVVKDTGVGMTAEQKASLFKGRLTSKKGTDGEKGSGLGLWIIGDMLQRVHGSIQIESEIDKGSTFIASIPKFQ